MRFGKIVAGLTLGTTVGLGLMSAPAQAAPTASAGTESVVDSQNAQASRHFYSSHWTRADCQARGNYWMSLHPTWTAECAPGLGTDGKFKYHLYMWY